MDILGNILPALRLFLVLSLLTGGLYPLAVTGLSQALFPAQAAGSLIVRNGAVMGSRLIGQQWDDPGHFWGRPSATTSTPPDVDGQAQAPVATPYNAASSSGSNQGPLNPALTEAVQQRLDRLRAAGGTGPVPVDLVTASGSGLDPHVSPAAALWQVPRVARARGLDEKTVAALVQRHVEGRLLGILGEPRVNVLELNLALEALTATGGAN